MPLYLAYDFTCCDKYLTRGNLRVGLFQLAKNLPTGSVTHTVS